MGNGNSRPRFGRMEIGGLVFISWFILLLSIFGVPQALLAATTVWFLTYFICRKFKINGRFSANIASANTICGVTATIAAEGAHWKGAF